MGDKECGPFLRRCDIFGRVVYSNRNAQADTLLQKRAEAALQAQAQASSEGTHMGRD